MTICLIASIIAIIASAFVFFEHIVISSASIAPLVLIGLSIFQAVLFKLQENEKWDHTNNTAYSTGEVDVDATKLSMKYHALTKIAIIPLLCVFVIYFNTAIKIVVPIAIYLLSFFFVRLLVKFSKNK